jgi:DoxX-like family
MTQMQGNSRVMLWAGRVLWTLFVLFMVMDVTMKLIRLPVVEATGQGLGLPAGSGFGIGVMELVILALYVWPRTAILGVVLVTALMGGTAATHFIAGSPWGSSVLFGVYLALIAWGGLWFREPALRALLPLRRA